MNMDDRQARALGPGQLAQPAFVKAKAGMGCLTLRDRTKTGRGIRSEEHTSELQSLMRISYAVFCLKNKINRHSHTLPTSTHLAEGYYTNTQIPTYLHIMPQV